MNNILQSGAAIGVFQSPVPHGHNEKNAEIPDWIWRRLCPDIIVQWQSGDMLMNMMATVQKRY
ncbi:MAG: hypothetical protein ABSD77_07790 [Verrucomicrobiota bacterium]|jgi:hypothetical protein